MHSFCGLSLGYLNDSGFSVATFVRKSVLAPAHAAVALFLISAFCDGGHLSGLSRRTVGAGCLRLSAGRFCLRNITVSTLACAKVHVHVSVVLHKQLKFIRCRAYYLLSLA